ncbi:hypothetical protein GCM10010964_40120 [Caldovatus sediminis]|uniref:Uncharacterized protein n=1 Tax=Caldovatus sediminis TaxID=2041189 RepID=A0A8J3EF06_9PROT|nr:hypothetical protein GCM10010964_40120 [Caldovatus sediminis]
MDHAWSGPKGAVGAIPDRHPSGADLGGTEGPSVLRGVRPGAPGSAPGFPNQAAVRLDVRDCGKARRAPAGASPDCRAAPTAQREPDATRRCQK